MDKSKICVTKAVNLAKTGSVCARKQNLLVYDKKRDPCDPPPSRSKYAVPRITAAAVKHIRVCTGAELKKMCPPPLCPCPTKKPSAFGGLFGLLSTGFKGLFAAALVYWTYDLGLWGPQDDTEKIYKGMCDTVAPFLTFDDDDEVEHKHKKKSKVCAAQEELTCLILPEENNLKCCDHPPSISAKGAMLKNAWNFTISTVFDLLCNGPERAQQLYHLLMAKYETMTAPPPDD